MMVSNRVMWAVLAVAAGAGLAAVLMPPARSRWRAQDEDQSNRVDEASEDSFPASDPPSFSADIGAQAGRGRAAMRDINSEVAGWLRDLAFVQTSTQSRWGYKRAASAVMYLPVPIDTLLNPDGTLQKIPSIGPASTRVILEVLRDGTSPIVDRAIEAAEPKTRADILRRRELRSHFLSRAAAEAAMRSRTPDAPSRADIRCDLQMHSDWSDGGQTLEEIIETGISRGYTHSAVTDHSYGLPIAGGLSMARVEQQHREIDALNAQYQRPLSVAERHRGQHPRRRLRRHDVCASSR